MKVWVADQVGNIKSHLFNDDGSTELNSPIIETVSTPQDHGGYVQIMAHAKWKTSNKYIVISPPSTLSSAVFHRVEFNDFTTNSNLIARSCRSSQRRHTAAF